MTQKKAFSVYLNTLAKGSLLEIINYILKKDGILAEYFFD